MDLLGQVSHMRCGFLLDLLVDQILQVFDSLSPFAEHYKVRWQ